MSKIGVINEVGDMGLGFDVLNEKDQQVYNEEFRPAAQPVPKGAINEDSSHKSTTKN